MSTTNLTTSAFDFHSITRGSLFSIVFLLSTWLIGQQTVVSGKVTEVATGTPVPFATVSFNGTSDGAVTDFDGNFIAKTSAIVDPITANNVGYIMRVKEVRHGIHQTINFQLDEDVVSLNEVVILAGENPAFPILKKVRENKKRNDKRQLEAYEYESYTRTEFDVNEMTEKFRQRKIMAKITNVLDSIEQIAGEDGQLILPIFISEAISKFHYRKNPEARHEQMIRTKISGIGITDGTLTSQVIGSSFQEYNFCQNWLNIFEKQFTSPLADGGRLTYYLVLRKS